MKIARICVLIFGIQLFSGINNLFGCLKFWIQCHTTYCLISASSIQLKEKHISPELVKERNPAKLEAQHISMEQAKNERIKEAKNSCYVKVKKIYLDDDGVLRIQVRSTNKEIIIATKESLRALLSYQILARFQPQYPKRRKLHLIYPKRILRN